MVWWRNLQTLPRLQYPLRKNRHGGLNSGASGRRFLDTGTWEVEVVMTVEGEEKEEVEEEEDEVEDVGDVGEEEEGEEEGEDETGEWRNGQAVPRKQVLCR